MTRFFSDVEDENFLVQRDRSHSWSRIVVLAGNQVSDTTTDRAVLIMLIDGHITITINEKSFDIHAGIMFLIPHNTSYAADIVEDSLLLACRFTTDTLLSPDYPLDSLTPFFRGIQHEFSPIEMHPLLWNFGSFVHTCLGESIHSLPFYERKKLELFDLLFACYEKKELADLLAPVIREGLAFRRLVLDNYNKVKDLDELISLTNLSRSGFYRNFALYFAKSPYDWMLEQKAILIRRDLIARVPPKEVTFRYGFSSMSHLTQFCKKQFNMTPSQIARLDVTKG